MGFGIAGFSGMPIVGAAAAGYFLYSAVESALQKGKQAEYIKDVGVIGHALKESDLVRYAEIVGVDAAIGEILQAYQDGQTITPAARKLCQAMGKTPKRRTIATFLEEIKTLQTLPDMSSTPSPTSTPSPASPPSIAGGACKILTVVDEMVNPVRSSYISAPPRTGKGILIALAMGEFKQRYPQGSLYTYTPKQDPKENWYWTSSDQHFNPDLDQNPTRAAQSLYAMIRHWQSLLSSPEVPILFVCDELSATMSRLKPVKMSDVDDALFTEDNRSFSVWLLDFLIHEASMRQSVDRFVWVMTPLCTVQESGVSASALKSLRNYTLASRDNLKFADGGTAAFAAPRISSDHPLLTRYRTIAYSHDSQTWLPIPTLSPQDIAQLSQSVPTLKHWGDPSIVLFLSVLVLLFLVGVIKTIQISLQLAYQEFESALRDVEPVEISNSQESESVEPVEISNSQKTDDLEPTPPIAVVRDTRIRSLRKEANQQGIRNASRMKKADLLMALQNFVQTTYSSEGSNASD